MVAVLQPVVRGTHKDALDIRKGLLRREYIVDVVCLLSIPPPDECRIRLIAVLLIM